MFVYLTDIVFFGKSIGDTFVQDGFVAAGIQQNGIRFLSVASGTSRFLKIGFGGIWKIDVHYQTDIGLVDTHTEGIGGHHYPKFSVYPAFLSLVFGIIV